MKSKIIAVIGIACIAVIFAKLIYTDKVKDEVVEQLEFKGVKILTPEEVAKIAKVNSDPVSQLERAASMALTLKNMNGGFPTFAIASARLKSNGVACYEYGFKDTQGIAQAKRAALSEDGKLYAEGFNDAEMRKLWDEECIVPGGMDISKNLRLE